MIYLQTYLKILKEKGACPGNYRGSGEITCSERCGRDLAAVCFDDNTNNVFEFAFKKLGYKDKRRYEFVCNKLIEEGYEAEVFEEIL